MARPDPDKLIRLSQHWHIDFTVVSTCVEEGELQCPDEETTLSISDLLRLRRIQRLCETLEVPPAIALLLVDRTDRITRLEEELAYLKEIVRSHSPTE